MELDTYAIITEYTNGKAMNQIAKEYGTYTTTIKRLLEKHNIELRHDAKEKGTPYVKEGEKLILWAKAQRKISYKNRISGGNRKEKIVSVVLYQIPRVRKIR